MNARRALKFVLVAFFVIGALTMFGLVGAGALFTKPLAAAVAVGMMAAYPAIHVYEGYYGEGET